ncbi:MAG TPA: hypothetical protein VGP93_18275 [Polyangiaceae bacterium]|nr:hypothetical protein [Polyangiaceae bacterium]
MGESIPHPGTSRRVLTNRRGGTPKPRLLQGGASLPDAFRERSAVASTPLCSKVAAHDPSMMLLIAAQAAF